MQVAALDGGFWFTRDGGNTFPFRGTGVGIPSFAQALTQLNALTRAAWRYTGRVLRNGPASLRRTRMQLYRGPVHKKCIARVRVPWQFLPTAIPTPLVRG